jgi:hypothetical protein
VRVRGPAVVACQRRRQLIDARSGCLREHRRDSLGDRCEELPPGRAHLDQLVGNRRKDAHGTSGALVEVPGTEGARLKQVEHERIDLGPGRLEQIEPERGPSFGVGMDNAELCVPRQATIASLSASVSARLELVTGLSWGIARGVRGRVDGR